MVIPHAAADPLQCAAEQITVCTLGRIGAYLFPVKDTQHLNASPRSGIQEASGTAKDTVQIIQRGGGNILFFKTPDPGILP